MNWKTCEWGTAAEDTRSLLSAENKKLMLQFIEAHRNLTTDWNWCQVS